MSSLYTNKFVTSPGYSAIYSNFALTDSSYTFGDLLDNTSYNITVSSSTNQDISASTTRATSS
jgi:hypothetical protein